MTGRLRLLGVPSIEVDGVKVTSFRSSRIPALLGLLASRRGAWKREVIATTLWPDSEPEEGRHNLRQVILYTKQIFGQDICFASRQTVELLPDIESDVESLLTFQNSLRSPAETIRLAEIVVEEYKGEFLQGYDADWIFFVRAECTRAYVNALLLLADHHLESNNPTRAKAFAERAILIEPFLDGARARKIQALRVMGEEAAAHREFTSFKTMLASELGIEPSHLVSDALAYCRPSTPVLKSESSTSENPLRLEQESIHHLLNGDRPHQGLDLAAAYVPRWRSTGVASQGIAIFEQIFSTFDFDPSLSNVQMAKLGHAELLLSRRMPYECKEIVREILLTPADTMVETRALVMSCRIALSTHQAQESSIFAQRAIELASLHGQRFELADAYRYGANAAMLLEDLEEGERLALECLASAQEIVDWNTYATGLSVLAEIKLRVGNSEEVLTFARNGLERLDGKDSSRACFTRVRIHRILEELGELEQAEEGYRIGISDSRRFGDPFGLAVALTYLGDLLTSLGRETEAIALHSEALSIRQNGIERLGEATSLRGLGMAHLQLGNAVPAEGYLRESARVFLLCDAIPGHASALLGLAKAFALSHNIELALRVASRARHLLSGLSPIALHTIGPKGNSLISEVDDLIKLLSEERQKNIAISG